MHSHSIASPQWGSCLFVGVHVAASFSMQQVLGTWGTTINIIYESWWFQIMVVFCVLFHTLNGFRVVILDIWPKLLKYERDAVYLLWAIFIPIYALTVYMIVTKALTGRGIAKERRICDLVTFHNVALTLIT